VRVPSSCYFPSKDNALSRSILQPSLSAGYSCDLTIPSTGAMATFLDSGYPARIQEEDTASLSSASIATSRRPESTRTFGSPSKNERPQYFSAPSMSRHFSESSQQSRSMSPFSYRYDAGKASPNNVIILEREIDPLDTTSKPLQVIVPPFASPIRADSNHQSSATNSPHADTSEDLFPDDSLGSSQTSVQDDVIQRTVKPELPKAPVIPLVTTTLPAANSIVLAQPLAECVPTISSHTLLVPSTSSSPEIGCPSSNSSRRISRKQVPIWTSSMEDLEQSKTPNTRHSVPMLGSLINTAPYTDDASSMQATGRSNSLPLSSTAGALRDEAGIEVNNRASNIADRKLGKVPQIPIRNLKEEKVAPGIPTRSASLLKLTLHNLDKKHSTSGPQHPFDHFTYGRQSRSTPPPTYNQGQDEGNVTDERRPSDQTFTSGFSLTRLTDDEAPILVPTTERTTPSKGPGHLPELLRGYESGVRFSAHPVAGGNFGKSQSENHLPLNIARKAGSGIQSRNPRGIGMGGNPTKGRSTDLFTLPEVSSMSVPSFQRGISDGSGRNTGRPSPRESPMWEQSSAFAADSAANENRTKPRLFQRRSRTKQRSTTNGGGGMSSSDYASDASLSATSGGLSSSFGRGKRREKKIRKKREAAIFEAGPDRLPTPRELLAVSKMQVYNVDGEKVMFGDIVAGGGGVQTIVVFIRHW
jgi:hypothetical protein